MDLNKTLSSVLSSMTQEIRDSLSTAVEIGRWHDGSLLNNKQKATCLQAVIAWDATYGEITNEPFKIQKGGVFNGKALKPSEDSDVTVITSITATSVTTPSTKTPQ